MIPIRIDMDFGGHDKSEMFLEMVPQLRNIVSRYRDGIGPYEYWGNPGYDYGELRMELTESQFKVIFYNIEDASIPVTETITFISGGNCDHHRKCTYKCKEVEVEVRIELWRTNRQNTNEIEAIYDISLVE